MLSLVPEAPTELPLVLVAVGSGLCLERHPPPSEASPGRFKVVGLLILVSSDEIHFFSKRSSLSHHLHTFILDAFRNL